MMPAVTLVPFVHDSCLRCIRAVYTRNFNDVINDAAYVISDGLINFSPREDCNIQISIDAALLITNIQRSIEFSINADRTMACLFYNNGFVVWKRNVVEVFAFSHDGHKLARIFSNRIYVQSDNRPLGLILNDEWYRSVRKFDITNTSPREVFYAGSVHGFDCVPACVRALNKGKRFTGERDTWIINKVKVVKSNSDNEIDIHLDRNDIRLKISNNRLITINMPGFYCTVGMSSSLYVNCGHSKIYYNGNIFKAKFKNCTIRYDRHDNFVATRNGQWQR